MTIIPIALSLVVVIYIILPVTMFVQPLKMTIVESRPNTLHEGDKFRLVVMVTNPNVFIINSGPVSTTFDRNAVEHHNAGCKDDGMSHRFWLLQSTEMQIPTSCDDYMSYSAGETNATVRIQYHVNGKQYGVSASKMFTILSKTNP